MLKTVAVVDDFYADPDRVRALALERGSWLDRGERYSHETENAFSTRELVARFETLAGEAIHVDPRRMGFGVFAYYPGDADVAHTTHFDDTDWSAIVYLVPPERCRGGITFFRHRDSGLHGPPDDARARELGFRDRAHWLEDVYLPAKLRPDDWEPTAHVAMRFNRMVLLRGSRLFHRASSGFGSSPADGRLTQRFFFDSAHVEGA